MTLDPTDERQADHEHLTPDQYAKLFEVAVQVYMAADGVETVPEYAARAALQGEPPSVLALGLPDDTNMLIEQGIDFNPSTGEPWEN